LFFDYSLINIRGEVTINFTDRTKDILKIKVDNMKLKPYDCRYENLLIKNENSSNNFDILDLEIKLNNNKEKDENYKRSIFNENDFIPTIGRLKSFSLIGVSKSFKELVLFFEQNSMCLKENPLVEQKKLLDEIKPEDSTILKLFFSECTILLPESSKSANMIIIQVKDGNALIRKTNEVPKICVEPENKLLYIDKKACFNLNPTLPESNQFVPHTRVELELKDVSGIFYINNQTEPFFESQKLEIKIRSPQSDGPIMVLRLLEWKKFFNGKNVVSYKPSLNINVFGAHIYTTMVI
jgi:hypothetical protein